MKLIRTRELTAALTQELLTLKEHCEIDSGKTYSFQPEEQDPELSYRYYLIYENNLLISALIVSVLSDSDSPFCDFFAMTEPEYRDQGLFSDLYDEMLDDFEEEFPDVSISCDLFIDKETHLLGFLENLGYEETSREYLMEISKNRHSKSSVLLESTTNYPLLSSCYAKIFDVTEYQADIVLEGLKEFETWYFIKTEGQLVGMVLLMKEGDAYYLSNFGILPEYRRKNYAAEALKAIQNHLNSKILLQVSSVNVPAFSLYKKYGFQITKEFLCYHQDL